MKTKIVIVSAARTPIGSLHGYFKNMPATVLGSIAIQAAISRANINPNDVEEVLMGCVLTAGLGQGPARQAAIAGGIPNCVPCTTINKVCGSGLKAVLIAHDEILAGSYKIVIAGGMENMSRAPNLMIAPRPGSTSSRPEIFSHMMRDGLEDAYDKGKSMGHLAEQCATKYHISREAQDAYALETAIRAERSQKGEVLEEIVPITIENDLNEKISVHTDEGLKKVIPSKIATLPPAFIKEGTITAANSSSLADGAAALLLMDQAEAEKRSLNFLGKIIGHYTYAHQPSWFTTAPIGAINGLLKKVGWEKDEVDLFEINEAFAVAILAVIKELNISNDKVNINGGSIVLGHPIGASGARILVTLLYALKQKNMRRGIAVTCLGGGEAIAIAIEREPS